MLGKFSFSLATSTLLLEYTYKILAQPVDTIYHVSRERRKLEMTRLKPLNIFKIHIPRLKR